MDYTIVHLTTSAEVAEILIAALSNYGYEAFEETDLGVDAYIPAAAYDESQLQEALAIFGLTPAVSYTTTLLKAQNWNEVWEKNFEPIVVADRCIVRSSHHQAPKPYTYEIVINPKMSFGTGHHATTALMMEFLLDLPHQQKEVLDVGSGTGILAILSAKLGAAVVDALDTETWAIENARENFALNQVAFRRLAQGSLQLLDWEGAYDLVLANINRNVLLAEMSAYAELIKPTGGHLLLSGFYMEDAAMIRTEAEKNGLTYVADKEKDRWVSMLFSKG
ncbi:MAG TPA: 50S ribosomal protein L11 methyltransferase [Microscillaceae bacterium]|nr:50S ribosomal protein L11 methyltransferase [Microscillaceae bacterium]